MLPWLCERLNNAGNWVCGQLTEDADFGKKKIIFSDEAHFGLGGYINKQNCRIWGQKPVCIHWKADTPKMSHCLVWICGHMWAIFIRKWARGGRYSQWRPLSGHVERIFVQKKLKKRILAIFGFNRTVLRATQLKLHLMFYALFLKIALATELMSFGHLWAAIWHRWTTICGLLSKISITPPSRRQLTF